MTTPPKFSEKINAKQETITTSSYYEDSFKNKWKEYWESIVDNWNKLGTI